MVTPTQEKKSAVDIAKNFFGVVEPTPNAKAAAKVEEKEDKAGEEAEEAEDAEEDAEGNGEENGEEGESAAGGGKPTYSEEFKSLVVGLP